MINLLNIFIYLLTPLGGVLSYYSLLRIAFDTIFFWCFTLSPIPFFTAYVCFHAPLDFFSP